MTALALRAAASSTWGSQPHRRVEHVEVNHHAHAPHPAAALERVRPPLRLLARGAARARVERSELAPHLQHALVHLQRRKSAGAEAEGQRRWCGGGVEARALASCLSCLAAYDELPEVSSMIRLIASVSMPFIPPFSLLKT